MNIQTENDRMSLVYITLCWLYIFVLCLFFVLHVLQFFILQFLLA